MILKKYLLQEGEPGAAGAGAPAAAAPAAPTTLMTDGGNPNPADTSSAGGDTPANQQTPDPTKPAGEEGDGQTAAPERVVPEKYEFNAPEGVTLDTEVLGDFEALAKDLKMTQEEAQKVADLGTKLSQKFAAQQAQAIQTAAAEWVTATTADKEIGGDKLNENLAVGKKALDAFGTPELRALLNDSKLGNHPEVIRFMVRAGKAISQDGSLVRGGKGEAEQTTAQRMYPNMKP